MPGLFDDIEDDALELIERMADVLDAVLETLERIEDRLPVPGDDDAEGD